MPRVLRILNRLIIGGPSKNAVYLSRFMQPDFETMLVIGGKEDHEQDADFLAKQHGIEPYCIPDMKRPISPASDYKAYNQLKKLIKDFKPDIVHTHAAKSGALGRLAARSCKVPVVLHTFHGHVFHSYFNPMKTNFFIRTERYLAGLSDSIIAISEVQKKELAHDFRIAAENKFRVVPLGLDLDVFAMARDEKRKKFRDEFGIDNDTIAIAIIGRLVPVKNHSMFLRALKYVLSNTSKEVKAFIVGDGDSREQIMREAKELGIAFTTPNDTTHDKPLIFTSWRTDVDVICAGVDIIALTSLNEGTPVSLIEAQAAGVPVVSTRVGGIADVVIEGRTALLSDVNDIQGFSDHLLKLVNDNALRRSFSNEGSKFVMQKFSYQRLVGDMSKLYQELLERKRR